MHEARQAYDMCDMHVRELCMCMRHVWVRCVGEVCVCVCSLGVFLMYWCSLSKCRCLCCVLGAENMSEQE